MSFLQWSDQYRIGIAIFDAEHMRLIAMANDAYDVALCAMPDKQLHSVFMGLIDYTHTHFEHEERFFCDAGYPQAEAHKEHHAWLNTEVDKFRTRLEDYPRELLAVEVAKFLQLWLMEHILKDDLAYAKFLNAKGIF